MNWLSTVIEEPLLSASAVPPLQGFAFSVAEHESHPPVQARLSEARRPCDGVLAAFWLPQTFRT